MGKIKVLFAAENGDDDLIDYGDEEVKAFIEMRKKQKEAKERCKNILVVLYDEVLKENIEDILHRNFSGEAYYTNGKLDKLKSNYEEICSVVGECAIDAIIEQYHLDISDKEYTELVSYAGNLAVSKFEYVKNEFLKLAEERVNGQNV